MAEDKEKPAATTELENEEGKDGANTDNNPTDKESATNKDPEKEGKDGKPADKEPTIEELIAAAIEKDRSDRQKEAEAEEARKKGDFEKLLKDAEVKLKEANLKAWRAEAITEHKLTADWASLLNGETETEIKAAAKALRKRLDDEIKAAAKADLEAHPGTLPGQRGSGSNKNEAEKVGKTIAGAFGLGRIPNI